MKFKCFYFGLFIIPSLTLNAQESMFLQKNHSVSMEVLGLTYNYESPIAKRVTLIGRLGMQGGAGYSSSLGSYYAISPAISFETRFYYNILKRESSGKNIKGNSANFISLSTWYVSNPVIEHKSSGADFFAVTPQWGVRRVYWKHFMLEAGAGISYFFNLEGDSKTNLMLNLRLGYMF